MNKIINWFKYRLTDKFTIAHDLSPFWRPGFNEREELDHVRGLWRAKFFCWVWVGNHSMGSARILKGWHYWPEDGGTSEHKPASISS